MHSFCICTAETVLKFSNFLLVCLGGGVIRILFTNEELIWGVNCLKYLFVPRFFSITKGEGHYFPYSPFLFLFGKGGWVNFNAREKPIWSLISLIIEEMPCLKKKLLILAFSPGVLENTPLSHYFPFFCHCAGRFETFHCTSL